MSMVRIQSLGCRELGPGEHRPRAGLAAGTQPFLSASQIDCVPGWMPVRGLILETAWLDAGGRAHGQPLPASSIDQGVQRGTSELHVLQMSQAGDLDTWPASYR